MEIAKYGIEKKIEDKCDYISDTWASPDSIASLKKLIAQYDEIMQERKTAENEEEAH